MQGKTLLSFYILSILFVFAAIAPQKAAAQSKYDALSESNIRFFIEDMNKITAGDIGSSVKRAQAFLERHLHPHARFKSTLKYNIPGFPPQANSMALDKEDFIESINAGSKTLENYDNSVSILEIKISSDKRKATVFTQGRETGTMNAEGEAIPVEGNSKCHQIISLSEKGIIQIYTANCETVISFQDY